MSVGPALIWCPFPDETEARRVATALLDEGLIGFANILPAMISLFEWDEERGEDRETGVLFKTNAALLDRATARLAELHSYDTPAVLGWEITATNAATMGWLGALHGGKE